MWAFPLFLIDTRKIPKLKLTFAGQPEEGGIDVDAAALTQSEPVRLFCEGMDHFSLKGVQERLCSNRCRDTRNQTREPCWGSVVHLLLILRLLDTVSLTLGHSFWQMLLARASLLALTSTTAAM